MKSIMNTIFYPMCNKARAIERTVQIKSYFRIVHSMALAVLHMGFILFPKIEYAPNIL